MGINNTSYNSILASIDKYIDDSKNKKLVELGIQESYFGSDFTYLRDKISNKFLEYISLDLHDILGVTIFDLAKFNPSAFEADVITNIGTSEHVEYEEGQYNCWKNIHSWLKVGGICIHELPEVGSWSNHCRYYCDFEFFKYLTNYGYEILEIRHHHYHDQGNLVWCVLRKIENKEFMTQEDFYSVMKLDKNVTSEKIDNRNNPKNLII